MRAGLASVLLLSATLCAAQSPALQVAVTQKGLDYVTKVGVPMVEKEVDTMSIPDVSTEQDSFQIDLQNIKCGSTQIGDASLKIDTTAGVTADWHYHEVHWPHWPNGNGDVDVSISGSSASVDVGLSAVNGRPRVNARSCSTSVHISHLHFHGGLSGDILNLLTGLLKGHIESEVDKAVCNAVSSLINNKANQVLSTFNMNVALPLPAPFDISMVDLSLLSDPTGQGFLGAELHGEVYSIANKTEAPYPTPTLPTLSPSVDTYMVEMAAAPFLLESAAYVYAQSGLLQYELHAEDIPPSVPFQLSTATFEDWAPEMYKEYPDTPMALHLAVTGNPTMSVVPGNASLVVPMEFQFQVEAKSGLVQAFGISCPFVASANLTINDTTTALKPYLTYLSCVASLDWSNVGSVSVSDINAFLEAILSSVALQMINQKFAGGIPLPTLDGIALTNPVINMADGYIQILTDVSYTPSAEANLANAAPRPRVAAPAPAPVPRTLSMFRGHGSLVVTTD